MEELEDIKKEDLTDGDEIGERTRVLAAALQAVDVVEANDSLGDREGTVVKVVVVMVIERKPSGYCAGLLLPLPALALAIPFHSPPDYSTDIPAW